MKHLDRVTDEEIVNLNIATGMPLVYELDDDLRPTSHAYLADVEAFQAAVKGDRAKIGR